MSNSKIVLKGFQPRINISKSISFVSSLLFLTGLFLLVSASSDWLSLNVLNNVTPELFQEYRYIVNISFFMVLLTVLVAMFPSGLSKEISSRIQNSLKIDHFSIYYLLSRIETAVILFAIVRGLLLITSVIYVKYFVIALLAISILNNYKRLDIFRRCSILKLYEKHLGRKKVIYIFTAGFLSKVLVSTENLITLALALLIPDLKFALPAVLIYEIVLVFRILIKAGDQTNKGLYFGMYTSFLTAVMVIILLYLSM